MSRKAYSEEERESIRVGLMDRAMTLFSEKGIRDTNIDEIYALLGISKTFFSRSSRRSLIWRSP